MYNFIIDLLSEYGWITTDTIRDDNGELTHIYFKQPENELIGCLIMPHSGNDYSFLFRFDFEQFLDRWSVAAYNCYIDNNIAEVGDQIHAVLGNGELIYNIVHDYYYEEDESFE